MADRVNCEGLMRTKIWQRSLTDVEGKRFGRLVAQWPVGRVRTGRRGDQHVVWLCVCDCGSIAFVRRSGLGGKTPTGMPDGGNSCGCLQRDVAAEQMRNRRGRAHPSFIHGHSAGGKISPTYVSWSAMWNRCKGLGNDAYEYYVSKGVTVCDRWKSFENFLADMGERPEGKSIDRYPDTNGNYEPGNCRWATPREQQLNSRKVVAARLEGLIQKGDVG